MTRRSSRSSGKTCAISAANLPERLEYPLAWSGVGFVVLAAANRFVDDDSWTLTLGGAAIGFLVVFLGALRAALRRREGEAGALSAVAVIAGSVVAAGELVAVLLELGGDPGDVRVVLAWPTAALVSAASVAILTTAALPRAVGQGWSSVLCSLLPASRSPKAASSPSGLVSDLAFLLFLAWVLATSVALARRGP